MFLLRNKECPKTLTLLIHLGLYVSKQLNAPDKKGHQG